MTPCPNTNAELILQATRALDELEQTREAKEEVKRQLKRSAEGSGAGSTAASVNPIAASSFFVPRTTPGSQPSIGSMLKRNEKEKADNLLAKFLL